MNPTIDDWAADFAETTAYATLRDALKEHAVSVCASFLHAACDHPGLQPSEIDEGAVKHAMLDHMPELDLPPEPRKGIPEILSAFLESLQDAGRLAGGRALGQQVLVLAKAYHDRCALGGGIRIPPVRNAAPKISRNDPCPCGSGKKYKKCCSRTP